MRKKEGVKSYLLNIPASLWKKLQDYSNEKSRPVSYVLREAIEDFLNTRIGGKNAGKNT
jgi:predicted DNA-binding protein